MYSLGNFWFDDYDIDTLVAELHIKGKRANSTTSAKEAASKGATQEDASPETASAGNGSAEDAAREDSPLKDAEIELKLYPGTQTGVYTGLADTEEWKSRVLGDLENISVNVNIDEDGVVHPDDQ